MTKIYQSLAGLILFTLFTGCTLIGHKPPPDYTETQTTQHSQSDLDEVMRYYDSLRNKSEQELTEEYNYADNHYRESIDARQRLKFLILLLLPNTDFQNIRTALDLLENPPQQTETTPDMTAFKNLLTLLLKQQQTAGLQVQNLSAKLRATEAEVKTLQNKINAIKNIEKNLMRRNTP